MAGADFTLELNDQVLVRFGNQLRAIGSGKANKVLGRALNYEGAKVYTAVRRAIRQQSSIPDDVLRAGMKTIKASTSGGPLVFVIHGSGKELSLRHFKPAQGRVGTSATVWGKRQLYAHAFMGPVPGTIAAKLGGHVFVRLGSDRLPIKRLSGPSIPREMVRDESREVFESAMPRILDRVAAEIAAVMRGY